MQSCYYTGLGWVGFSAGRGRIFAQLTVQSAALTQSAFFSPCAQNWQRRQRSDNEKQAGGRQGKSGCCTAVNSVQLQNSGRYQARAVCSVHCSDITSFLPAHSTFNCHKGRVNQTKMAAEELKMRSTALLNNNDDTKLKPSEVTQIVQEGVVSVVSRKPSLFQ